MSNMLVELVFRIRCSCVSVSMVQVRIVGMTMDQRLMTMPVAVRFTHWAFRPMRMLMMCVVDMAMLVLDRLMAVNVIVALSQVQPDPQSHQSGSRHELQGYRFMQKRDRQCSAHERCN